MLILEISSIIKIGDRINENMGDTDTLFYANIKS